MIGKEVFIVTQYEDSKETMTAVRICESLDQANEALSDISFGNIDEDACRMYQGIVIPATYVPKEFKNCTPYMIVYDPIDMSDEFEFFPVVFEKLKSNSFNVCNYIQEAVARFNEKDAQGLSIDNILLFFGEQLSPVLQVTQDLAFGKTTANARKLLKQVLSERKALGFEDED